MHRIQKQNPYKWGLHNRANCRIFAQNKINKHKVCD